jgi:hypothetical protein
MADIRQTAGRSGSEGKAVFEADSVASDLWRRQNYHEIHLELDAEEAKRFVERAEGAGLILENTSAC